MAEQQEAHRRRIGAGGDDPRRFKHRFQRMGHAMGADVAGDEGALQSQCAGQLRILGLGRELGQVDAVGDDIDLGRIMPRAASSFGNERVTATTRAARR